MSEFSNIWKSRVKTYNNLVAEDKCSVDFWEWAVNNCPAYSNQDYLKYQLSKARSTYKFDSDYLALCEEQVKKQGE